MQHNRISFGRLLGDECGAILLLFIIVIPFLALLLCAVIEFGWYFARADAMTRAMTVTYSSIINLGGDVSQAVAYDSASGTIAFGTGGNYICAKAYATYAAATSGCVSGECNTSAPGGVTPYFVAIAAYAAPTSLTGFVDEILPNREGGNYTAITQSKIVEVGLPTCLPGQFLTYSGTTVSCATP